MQIDVTRAALSAYENQTRYPSYDVFVNISRAFGVTDNYLPCGGDRCYIDITGRTEEESAAIRQMVYLLQKSKKVGRSTDTVQKTDRTPTVYNVEEL